MVPSLHRHKDYLNSFPSIPDPMNFPHARGRWLRTVMVLGGLIPFLLAGCASVVPEDVKAVSSVNMASLPSEDDDWTQLKTQMRIDLNRYNSREIDAHLGLQLRPVVVFRWQ